MENGLLVIRTPDRNGLLPQVLHALYVLSFEKLDMGVRYLFREHLYHFTLRTLRLLLMRCGFHIQRVAYEDYVNLKATKNKAWADNPLVRLAVSFVAVLARLLRKRDIVFVYAVKTESL